MVSQAVEADVKVAHASQGRTVALQEAALYRAKLAAIESHSPADLVKIDRDRSADLERKLAGVLADRADLERRVAQLGSDLERDREARRLAEERAIAATQRAEATESSYSRSLSDYAELQRRAHSNESTLQEHVERSAVSRAQSQRLQADHAHAKSRLESAEASVNQYLKTLEQTQATLTAANVQADEMQALWDHSKAEAVKARAEAAKLQVEVSDANARIEELDIVLRALRNENEAMRSLTTDSLAELVSSSRELKARSSDNDAVHSERLQAAQDEVASFRELHSDSRARAETAQTELAEAHGRESHLERQALALRSEIAALRALHATTFDDAARHRAQVVSREADLDERNRMVEVAEAKSASLHALLAEHGIAADDLGDGSPSLGGNGAQTLDHLSRRVRELEARLEAREQAYRVLESARDDARHDLEAAERQLRDGARHRQMASDQVSQLQDELQRAKSPLGRQSLDEANPGRAQKAESDLQDLQERHKSLEASHMKAVQYVKVC